MPNLAAVEPKLDDELGSERNCHAAIVDEAMRQLKPFHLVEAKLADFDQIWAEVEAIFPSVHSQLKSMRLALRPILKGKVKATWETYDGWSDAAIRQALGEVPDNLVEMINQLELMPPKFEPTLSTPESCNEDRVTEGDGAGLSHETIQQVRAPVDQNNYREMIESVQALAANWLVPLLKVWGKLSPGSFQIKHGVLSVLTHNLSYFEDLKVMKWVGAGDATANREALGLYLGIEPTSILQTEPTPKRYDNLHIIQVTGLGLVSHNRSKSLIARLEVIRLMLKHRHPDISFMEHKEYAQIEAGDGWWFNRHHASNEYLSSRALASFGVPYQDIGSLQMIYITLTGENSVNRESPGFAAFMRWQAQAEIAQCVRRLWATRRPDDVVTYYSCADFELDFLGDYCPGAVLTTESAFSIDDKAGTATQQSHHQVQSAIFELMQSKKTALEKITQVDAASQAGITQGRISQVAAKYGGWKAYKQLLATGFEPSQEPYNNSAPVEQSQEFIAKADRPLATNESPPDGLQAVGDCIERL